ncbi:hypothetical protein [Priestia sp. P5]|uniref:hypothetical protein n=1 Tax=Priestia sp. P5 TaxID=2917806 RepID=UPI0024076A17|nr:hypothetical protein [Priestia sp. P5]MDG0062001.1 hypothetical protein [Priestia sp. P5]
MRKLFIFLILTWTRIKNRIVILAYKKPEAIFGLLLLLVASGVSIKVIPSMFNLGIEIDMGIFPQASYIFFMSGLIPYIFSAMKNKSNTEEQHSKDSLLNFVCEGLFKYLSFIIAFLMPVILSVITLFMVLSIYDNVSIFYSVLFWEVMAQVVFIIALFIRHLIQRVIGKKFTSENETILKQFAFLGSIIIILILPIHNFIGYIWLGEKIALWVLIALLAFLLLTYICINSMAIQPPTVQLFNQNRYKFFKKINFSSVFLVFIYIREYIVFFISMSVFLLIISVLANNYYSISQLFVLGSMLAVIHFVFNTLSKTVPGIAILRISQLKYSVYVLHVYFLVGLFFMVIFLEILSMLNEVSFTTLLSNVDFMEASVMFYCSIYFSILVYYLFSNFFGPLAQAMTSVIILLISYRITPEYLMRVQEFPSVIAQTITYVLTISVFCVVMTITINGLQDDTRVT